MCRPRLATTVALAVTAVAIAGAALTSRASEWDAPLVLVTLFALAVLGDRFEAVTSSGSRVVGSMPAFVLAAVLLGPAPAVAVGLASSLLQRKPFARLAGDLATFTAFPLVTGLAARELLERPPFGPGAISFVLVVVVAFLLAWVLNFACVALYGWLLHDRRPTTELAATLLPLLDGQIAIALLTGVVAYLHQQVGFAALALSAVVLVTYNHLQRRLLQAKDDADELRRERDRLARVNYGLIRAMVEAVDARDRMTARHSAAVAHYAQRIAEAAGCTPEECERVHTAGLLHDVGKFIFTDAILKGDERPTEEEWQLIRRHPEQGAAIVRRLEGHDDIAEIILAHHERVDGSGYPFGLAGDEIPLLARMISIADTFDVMTARDSYRRPVASAEAIAELRRVSGSQLDGELVELFVELLEDAGVAFRHNDDADFEAELDFDRRVREYAQRGAAVALLPPVDADADVREPAPLAA